MTTADAPSAIDARLRSSTFGAAEQTTYDLIVIGAGITGAGIARDAALRGLSVAVVEARDVASGTSSRSSKMIHGGLRYLAHGDISLVKEAARERQTLRSIAPHLTRYAEFLMPGTKSILATMKAGLVAFERLGRVPRHERHEMLLPGALLEREPLIRREAFAGGVRYVEFLTDDARLTLANVRSAAAAGATVLTHAPVTRVLVEGGRATGVECRASLPGEDASAVLRGRCIVNAAGPWVDAVRALEDGPAPSRLSLTKGIHVVVPHEALPVRQPVITLGRDQRPVFAVPRGAVTYLGTTDTFYPQAEAWPSIERSDVSYLLEAMGQTFGGPALAEQHILAMWAGVRPLVAQVGKQPSEVSRKDEVWVGPAGVVSIAGGKLTAYRTMAERVTDRCCDLLGAPKTPCTTAQEPLVGAERDPFGLRGELGHVLAPDLVDELVDRYGAEAVEIVAGATAMTSDTSARRPADHAGVVDEHALPPTPAQADPTDIERAVLAAATRHAVLSEGALTLEDLWYRRLGRAWFSREPVGAELDRAGDLMGDLLRWDAARRSDEVAHCRALHARSMSCLDDPEALEALPPSHVRAPS